MLIIKHRINTISELKKIPKKFGVEVDLRSNKKDIYLHHNPFSKGVLFNKWVKYYDHKLIVLNVKEEGLEKKIVTILKKNKIKDYFFHDQTFSSLLKNKKITKVSIRISEYEELKKKKYLFKYIKWVWVDHFNIFELNEQLYRLLKKQKVKICIVSPELVNLKNIKKIIVLKKILKVKKYIIDAVCTKRPDIWLN
jgi:hypothetical protein